MITEQKELWDSFGGVGIAAEYAKYADKTETDALGNDIRSTYAKNSDLPLKMDSSLLGTGTYDVPSETLKFLTYYNNVSNDIDHPYAGSNSNVISSTYSIINNTFDVLGTASSFQTNNGGVSYPVDFIDNEFTFDFFCKYITWGSGYNTANIYVFGIMFSFYSPGAERRFLIPNSDSNRYIISYQDTWFKDNSNGREFKSRNDWRNKYSNHVALVFKKNENAMYMFYNGVLQFKIAPFNIDSSQSGIAAYAYVDTYAFTNLRLRVGDYSNNLQSFDIPTSVG